MSLPGLGPRRDADASARVRGWAREVLGPDNDCSIVVTELACTEPGCPPIETVIGVLGAGEPVQHKIHKPLGDITADDVATALTSAGHDHP